MTIEIALLISLVSVSFAIFFGMKNAKRGDVKDIEQRVAERTETNMKLDEIGRNVQDIKYDITATKNEVKALGERIVSVEQSTKSLHHRVDTVESRLNMKKEE